MKRCRKEKKIHDCIQTVSNMQPSNQWPIMGKLSMLITPQALVSMISLPTGIIVNVIKHISNLVCDMIISFHSTFYNFPILLVLGHSNEFYYKPLCFVLHTISYSWLHTVNDKSFTVRKLSRFSRIFSKPRKFSLLNFCSTESWHHEEIFGKKSRGFLPRD